MAEDVKGAIDLRADLAREVQIAYGDGLDLDLHGAAIDAIDRVFRRLDEMGYCVAKKPEAPNRASGRDISAKD